MYYQNLINQKIGKWHVLQVDEHGTGKHTKMLCRCECGREKSVDAYSLYHGLTNSCGKCSQIIEEDGHMRCITKSGASFIFDKIDEPLVRSHTWSLARGHFRTVIGGRTRYLHQLIMGSAEGEQVDHINMDKSDNRRCNLRYATHAENQQNKGLRSDSTTGYKGVCFDKRSGKYVAYINAEGHRTYLGYFSNKKDGAEAYDKAAKILHGGFAKLNFKEGLDAEEEILEMAQ